jgi:hypothetical protein
MVLLATTKGRWRSILHRADSSRWKAGGSTPPHRAERAAIIPVSLSIGRREAPVRGWDGASEEEGQKVGGTGWSADIERRASVLVGCLILAVLEE